MNPSSRIKCSRKHDNLARVYAHRRDPLTLPSNETGFPLAPVLPRGEYNDVVRIPLCRDIGSHIRHSQPEVCPSLLAESQYSLFSSLLGDARPLRRRMAIPSSGIRGFPETSGAEHELLRGRCAAE